MEHRLLHNFTCAAPKEANLVSPGTADVKRHGNDVTVVATPRVVLVALNAAQELARQGIEAEVIDPCTPKALDIETIKHKVQDRGIGSRR
jgi:pyruvate/2-oxoglutarate/acetoin dehydrogenase E1 component